MAAHLPIPTIVHSDDDRPLAYLTDVEGMWSRLATFAHDNPCLTLAHDDTLTVAPGCVFVFGGDAVDRGPWSRRIVRALLDVKTRQPEQVVLLAGNRDINKLRLPRELAGHLHRKAPPEVRSYTPPELLRWIFNNTMNAGQAYEHRREELVWEQRAHDDSDVVTSFLVDLAEGGEHRAYLRASQLAYRNGCNLFVHGGVTDENLGVVPGRARTERVDAWVAGLNDFYTAQLSLFSDDVIDAEGTPAWLPLILYQAPRSGTRLNQQSVVYGRTTDGHNNAVLPRDDVMHALVHQGIRRVLVGHTPNGDLPSILRTVVDERLFELWFCDNSRSRVETGSLVLLQDGHARVRGRTILDDGSVVDVQFALDPHDVDSPIGKRRKSDAQLIKAPVDDDYLLFRYQADYAFTQTRVSRTELAQDTLVAPTPDTAPSIP